MGVGVHDDNRDFFENPGVSRVLVERVSRHWGVLGSWVALNPPEQQGQLVQQVGFVGEVTVEGRRPLSLL